MVLPLLQVQLTENDACESFNILVYLNRKCLALH